MRPVMALDSIRDLRLFTRIYEQASITAAAELLGMTRPTLYDLMDRYGLRNAGHK